MTDRKSTTGFPVSYRWSAFYCHVHAMCTWWTSHTVG